MSIVNESLPVDEQSHQIGSVEYRRNAGKALRKIVSRRSHAKWSPAADRPDPISLLEEQNRPRLDYLVPLRFERMSASPFTFLRGTAIVMAADLAATPVSGIHVQMCGDAPLTTSASLLHLSGTRSSISMTLTRHSQARGNGTSNALQPAS